MDFYLDFCAMLSISPFENNVPKTLVFFYQLLFSGLRRRHATNRFLGILYGLSPGSVFFFCKHLHEIETLESLKRSLEACCQN
jgi:hypothetical protein